MYVQQRKKCFQSVLRKIHNYLQCNEILPFIRGADKEGNKLQRPNSGFIQHTPHEADSLQIRLATVSHVSVRADYPLLRLFCVVSGYPTFTAVLFLLHLQGRVSCTFLHVIIIIIFIAFTEYIQL
jgi:hypothetical protein